MLGVDRVHERAHGLLLRGVPAAGVLGPGAARVELAAVLLKANVFVEIGIDGSVVRDCLI